MTDVNAPGGTATSATPPAPVEVASKRPVPGPSRPGWRGTFNLLGDRNFRYLLAGNIMVSIGYNIRQMAQAWLVLDLTGSSLKAGLVNSMPSLAVFTSLYAGAVLDRGDRRKVLALARLSLALHLLAAAVLIATGAVEWWHLLIIGLGLSMTFTFHDPAGQALTLDVAGRGRLIGAVSMISVFSNVVGFVAPAVGGALIALGISWAFWLLVCVYGISFLVVLPMRVDPAPAFTTRSIIADMKDGLRYARGSATIRWLLILTSVLLFTGMAAAILPIFAREVFDVGATGYGWLATTQGAGALFGAMLLTLAGGSLRAGIAIFLNMFLATVALAILGVTPWYWLAFPAMFMLGASQASMFITLPAILQRESAPEMRGRVMGLFFMVVTLFMLGWLVGGALNTVIGARETAMAAAAGTALLAVFALARSRVLRQLA